MAYTTIDKPTDYFNTKLYVGDGGTPSITGVGFQPDWVWIKNRTSAEASGVFDAVRGVTKMLSTQNSDAQSTTTNSLTAFGSDGFSVGANNRVNQNSNNIVSWNWKETADAGFDIVSYTGNGTAGKTVAHSLSAVPKMIILKRYNDGTASWMVYHHTLGNNIYLSLDTTAASDTGHWDSTSPTSSVFSVSGDQRVNNDGASYIAYCFSEKQGYSKFGTHTGNDNADGTFVYLGFSPAFLMIKRTNSVNDWIKLDNKRNPINPSNERILANTNAAASTANIMVDFLSNGFKPRSTYGGINGASDNFIYMAFAENPFVTSTGVPATAR